MSSEPVTAVPFGGTAETDGPYDFRLDRLGRFYLPGGRLAGRTMRTRGGWPVTSVPDPVPPPARVIPETVEALLATVRDLLQTEDSREQSLLGRGLGLAGFAGLLLSLAGAASTAVFSTHLERHWQWAAFTLVAVALACLAITVGLTIRRVLRPRESVGIAMAEVEDYPTYAFVTQQPEAIQGRTMRGLIQVLAKERTRNSDRAEALRHAYDFFAAAMLALAALGGILGAHALNLI